ncbi:MAG: TIGR03936 family radical SAM-associated protein [Chloroflexota bacterium]
MNDRSTGPRQRWQIRFARTQPALRLRQAELIAEWERVFRAAELPLSYSAALKPRPRIRLAANPPMGIELRGEIVEAYFDELVPLERIMAAGEQLTDGLSIEEAREVWHGFPSAASQLRGAEYELDVKGDELTDEALRGAIVRLLASPTLPGMRHRGESERRSDAGKRDLRPLIEDVEVISVNERSHTARLRLVLRLDSTGAGRPEDVVAALDIGVRPSKAVRTRLLFVDTPPIAR